MVWRRRISVVNPPAFLRILIMSVGAVSVEGAGAGDFWAKVVVEEKKTSRRSVREKNGCFIITIVCRKEWRMEGWSLK